MKIGLLLEGGGMRGMYTAGILDSLLEQSHIAIDTIVGVSAGALFGVNYVSEQKGRALRYNQTYVGDPRYMGMKSLVTTGNIVNKAFAFYEVPFTLDPFDNDTFKQSSTTFYAGVTNMKTGQAEFMHVTDVFEQMEVLRASSALPLVSKPVLLGQDYYLDGGIADSVPIQFLQSLALDKIIVVLTRPIHYRKSSEDTWINKVKYRKYPALQTALATRHQHYNDTLDQLVTLEAEGDVFVLRPSEDIVISRLEKDPQKLEDVYQIGVRDFQNRLPELEAYLKQKHD